MLHAIAAGELLIDFTQSGTQQDGYPMLCAHPGGAPANYSAAFQARGLSAAFIGKVGQDRFGELLIQSLQKAGIDTRGVIQDNKAFTTLAFVTLDEKGERSFSFARKPGADTCLQKEEIPLDLIDSAALFHFGSLSLTGESSRSALRFAAEYAKKQGKLLSFDPNYRPPLWQDKKTAAEQMLWGIRQADIVKISREELFFLYECDPEEGFPLLFRDNPELQVVFVTMGENGCRFATPRESGFVPAFAVHQVDTTGAGDIFGGTADAEMIKTGKQPKDLTKNELERIVRTASAAAALSTEQHGGIASVPDRNRVQTLLQKAESENMPSGASNRFDRI